MAIAKLFAFHANHETNAKSKTKRKFIYVTFIYVYLYLSIKHKFFNLIFCLRKLFVMLFHVCS